MGETAPAPVVAARRESAPEVPLPFDPGADADFSSRYQLEAVLGRGGMGVVYRGVQLALHRAVAIKFVLAPTAHALERFAREQQLVARLNHPNVVQVHDAGDVRGMPYLVMELVEGNTLREHMDANGGRLPADEAVHITRQALNGLEYVHGHGAIHRDIKPANIFVTRSGVVKLGDFGLARAEDLATLTGFAEAMGTPAYMPPEQFEGPATHPSADLYSLGAVLYEMLSGRRPMEEKSFVDLLTAHRSNRCPLPIRSMDPTLPEQLDELLQRALEKNPRMRLRDAAQFRALLGRDTSSTQPARVRVQRASSPPADPVPTVAAGVEVPEDAPGVSPLARYAAVAWLAMGLLVAGWLFRARLADVPEWPLEPRARSGRDLEPFR